MKTSFSGEKLHTGLKKQKNSMQNIFAIFTSEKLTFFKQKKFLFFLEKTNFWTKESITLLQNEQVFKTQKKFLTLTGKTIFQTKKIVLVPLKNSNTHKKFSFLESDSF